MKNAAKRLVNKLPKLKVSFAKLTRQDVLVGVPRDETARKDGGPNNATLAYIHDNGAPASNIPARPFMDPGIQAAKKGIVAQFQLAAKRALHADDEAVTKGLHGAGLVAQASIRNTINAGIGPALKTSTLRARLRNRTGVKGAKAELESRAAGNEAGMANAKPLVATGQLRNSINYVVRKK